MQTGQQQQAFFNQQQQSNVPHSVSANNMDPYLFSRQQSTTGTAIIALP
jgi:hypothetical protein